MSRVEAVTPPAMVERLLATAGEDLVLVAVRRWRSGRSDTASGTSTNVCRPYLRTSTSSLAIQLIVRRCCAWRTR